MAGTTTPLSYSHINPCPLGPRLGALCPRARHEISFSRMEALEDESRFHFIKHRSQPKHQWHAHSMIRHSRCHGRWVNLSTPSVNNLWGYHRLPDTLQAAPAGEAGKVVQQLRHPGSRAPGRLMECQSCVLGETMADQTEQRRGVRLPAHGSHIHLMFHKAGSMPRGAHSKGMAIAVAPDPSSSTFTPSTPAKMPAQSPQ